MSRGVQGRINRDIIQFAAASSEFQHVTRGLSMNSMSLIVRRIGVFPVALCWLLVMPFSLGQSTADSAASTPEIRVHAVAADRGELEQKVRILNIPCGGRYQYLDHPTTVGKFEDGKVRAIQVVYFAGWKNAPTQEELRDIVRRVWQGKFQSASCQIDWDEGNIWTIEAVVEFDDGIRGELITDGSHVVLQGHDGKSHFLRLLPAAQ